jgi:uncharacterized protein (UPF0248 family)
MLPREILNKLKWSPAFNFENYEVVIVHRGAPSDVKIVKCKDILELGRGFFEVLIEGRKTMVPYHRIKEIREIDGKVIWKRFK